MRTFVLVSFVLASLSLFAPPLWSQEGFIPKGPIAIELETVASGLVAPLGVTHAGDGSDRIFIWEQSGQIRIVDADGDLLPTPFLDISAKLPMLGGFFDERGLLGLAFHPNYENNGRFFVRYSAPRIGAPDEPCSDPDGFVPGCHSEILAEYHVSAMDANVADPNSEIILLSVDEPQFNHNAGEVAFGPDGYLYLSLGDGGGGNDGLADMPPSHGPIGNGQNIETLLGSMLRLDVDSPPQGGLAYAIPADNPFVGGMGRDEIYAYGFRNPYKFSFDMGSGGTGALYVADVGQALFEEISVVTLGGNYGWVTREGNQCFDPLNPMTPPETCAETGPFGEPLIGPIAEYAHPGTGFEPVGGITIVGGHVHRGNDGRLEGQYIFGDFAQQFVVPSGRLYHFDPSGDGAIQQFVLPGNAEYGLFLKGFGQDEDGNSYVCGSTALAPFGDTGVVHRMRSVGGRKFRMDLEGDQEVPPVDSDGEGEFRIRKKGSKLEFRLKVEDLDGVVAAHIHLGAPGENGPVVVELFSAPGGIEADGRIARRKIDDDDIIARPALGFDGTMEGLLAFMRSGAAYVNVHTLEHPSGELRGQIEED